MQDTFIQAYPKLLQSDVTVAGLWLAHGDEPLLQQWLIDALRPHWRARNYAVKRIELVSVKSWQEVLSELGSLSLFDDASALIVTGNHMAVLRKWGKPFAALATAVLFWGEPQQAVRLSIGLRSFCKLYQLSQHGFIGFVIACHDQRAGIIKQ